jgi:hypothetical protein
MKTQMPQTPIRTVTEAVVGRAMSTRTLSYRRVPRQRRGFLNFDSVTVAKSIAKVFVFST